jgi:zinc protease
MSHRSPAATLAVGLAFGALVAAVPASAETPSISIPYEQYTLENGLSVLLHKDTTTPIAHVELWYHVGSKDEVEGRSGFAHLFEHLMFNGSEHADGEYFAPLQPLGARINGSTNTDRTNYFETVPTNGLELALWMEADRMGFLLPALTQEKLDNQRDVVRNERRQRYEITPYGEVWVYLSEEMYPAGHPYAHTTIGSHEDLEAATLDDVKGFFNQWYVPNNATLVVAGSFDEAQVKGWIQEYFGPIPRGPQPKPVMQADAGTLAAKTIEITDEVQLPRVYWAWLSPPFFADGDADLDVLSMVLADGKNSRLYKRLVFDDRIAKDVAAFQASSKLDSRYILYATVAPGHTVEEVQAALQEEIDRFKADGPTQDEVERATNAWQKSFYQRMESVAGRGGMLHTYSNYVGEPDYAQKDLERYLGVTVESLGRWAETVLDDGKRVELIVRPAPPAEDTPTDGAGSEGGAQ